MLYSRSRRKGIGIGGFTLVELTIVVAIVGTLATLAVPNFHEVQDRGRTTQVIGDIELLEAEIMTFYALNQVYPASLAAIGRQNMMDPWGNPYQYRPLAGASTAPAGNSAFSAQSFMEQSTDETGGGGGGVNPRARKDRFLVPINTDFDLFSMGADGDSAAPLTAKASRDDVVRAANGGYVGIATGF